MSAVRFDLHAPLASWPQSGVTYRATDLVPTWSALTGLVSAAMGWDRADTRQVRFSEEYAPAVEVISTGQRLVDYHTIQSPHAPSLKTMSRPYTRADELDALNPDGTPWTTITQREYVQDARYTILLLPLVDKPDVEPEIVAQRLLKPVFPLFAGRRSCVLGWVPAEVIEQQPLENMLPAVTHWDTRIKTALVPSVVRERRDFLVHVGVSGYREFVTRYEAVR